MVQHGVPHLGRLLARVPCRSVLTTAMVLVLFSASPALAGPVGALIGGIAGAVKAVAATTLGSFLLRTAVTVGLSLLARALAPKPRQPGIRTEVTTTGGTHSQAFVLGLYATAGHMVAPPMSHGSAGGMPNGYLTYIIELSDLPRVGLSRVIVDDAWSEIGGTAHPDYGLPLLSQRRGGRDHAWVRFHDGTQTVADPMLVARYGSHPDRPWTPDHIGTGTAYAILTFRYNRELLPGLPQVRFELFGIPLYDPRADTSVGGDGEQRWDDPATWAFSENPAVMIYNILRGIRLPDGRLWGGEARAADLPLANWFAAMTACDTGIGGRPQYRAGYEVALAEDEPAAVIAELLKVCCGQIAECGGVWRLRVGPPAAPVFHLSDEDVVISDPQSFEAFPGLQATFNAIAASYPEPASLWQSREAPVLANPIWEVEDGNRRLTASLTLPACPHLAQVGQVMAAYIRDERRFRVHAMVLPPAASGLEPLDTLAWTSTRNGYASKIFEVIEIAARPGTLCQEVTLRERDPADYDHDPGADLPQPAPAPGLPDPAPQPVEAWSVLPAVIRDAGAVGRRPALRLLWDGTAAEDAQLVRYEVRLRDLDPEADPEVGGDLVTSGAADARAGEVVISQGILPALAYEARGRYILARPSLWSAWLPVTAPDVRLGLVDLQAGISEAIDGAAQDAAQAAQAAAEAAQIATGLQEAVGSSLAFRLRDGSAGAELELIALADPAGPVSIARIGAANILLDGSVAARQLVVTDFSGNLVPNGSFRWGDLRGWSDVAQTFALEAVPGAPSVPVLRIDPDPASLRSATLAAVPVQPGQRFSLGFAFATAGSLRDATLALVLAWQDAAGLPLGESGLLVEHQSGEVWADVRGGAEAPAGAAGCEVRLERRPDGAEGLALVTAIEVLRQRPGAILITPNSIGGAQLVTTEALITSEAQIATGVIGEAAIAEAAITSAKIGEVIQSANYAPGAAGWQITKAGNAEFNTITIRRQQLENRATANGIGAYTAGSVAVNTTALTNIQTVSLATVGGRVLLTACFSFEGSAQPIAAFRRGTTTLMEINLNPGSSASVDRGTANLSFYDTPGSGTHSYSLAIRKFGSGSSSVSTASRSLSAFEFRQVT